MLHLPRTFRSIENRNCRLYFFGQLVSLVGSRRQSVPHGLSFELGLVGLIGQVPLLFLSPIGGLHK
jgi:hypothetical protein